VNFLFDIGRYFRFGKKSNEHFEEILRSEVTILLRILYRVVNAYFYAYARVC